MFKLLTEEHCMMRDAVRKVFTDLEKADTQKRQRERCRIDSAAVGDALTELGLLGESADASMAAAQVQAIAAVEGGAAALPFPVIEALAAQAVVLRGGSVHAQGSGTVSTLSSGASAVGELPMFDEGRLHGTARLVPFATVAASAVLEARRGGDVVLVRADLSGASFTRQPRVSVEPDYPLDDVLFEGKEATLVSGGNHMNAGSVAFLRDRITLLTAAEIAGACRRMVAMTRDYLLVRSQFGQVLGANQALKHKLADNHVRVEALTAAIEYAAAASDASAEDAEVSICAAKHFAARAGKTVADSTLQLHGAIGYTMEFPLQLLMRRVYRLGASYGSSRAQGERLFELFKQSS